jgi:ATP-dependent DNA helicase RecG
MRTIPFLETMVIEFKSDQRGGLPDRELVEAVVCLANAEGGTIYLGVEKDGSITGLDRKHLNVDGLPALIESRTSPSVHITAKVVMEEGKNVAVIHVPMCREIVATSDGKSVRRRLNQSGEPECTPFLPRDFAARLSQFGSYDFSAQLVPDVGPESLDPVERSRLRRAIETNALADKSLLRLSDDELDGALELIKFENGDRRITYAGLVSIGREDVIRRYVPNHEVAFQAFKGTRVTVNEFFRVPLIRVQEQLETYYKAHVVEQEVQVGMFRVGVPNVDAQAYREAVVNALTHRDYTARGQTYIQWKDDLLTISSPGGFLEGVTPDNILSVPPTPRNPVLANIFKRAGLSERTGRGVDLIYEGLVKYGRPVPSYARSNRTTVIVDVSAAAANLKFVELVATAQNKRGEALPLNALLVLNALSDLRRGSSAEISQALRVLDASMVRQQLELLVEAGLVQAHGVKKGRTYTLSSVLYGQMGKKTDYVRQAGISELQQKPMILRHIEAFKTIKREDVIALCGLTDRQATKLLAQLVEEGVLQRHGTRRGTYYTRPTP